MSKKKETNNVEIKKNNDELETLKQENADLNDKLLRSLAEIQNYKKRKDEELSRMLKYSDEDLILDLLPVIDNFERAIKLDDTDLSDELSKFLEGFKMIYTSVIQILNKYEVTEIESLNKEFDPTYHQAVITDNVEEKNNNVILEVLQKGYIYKDKVIRPTMVKVNIKGEMKNE